MISNRDASMVSSLSRTSVSNRKQWSEWKRTWYLRAQGLSKSTICDLGLHCDLSSICLNFYHRVVWRFNVYAELRVDPASSKCSTRDFQAHEYECFGIQRKSAFLGTEQQAQRPSLGHGRKEWKPWCWSLIREDGDLYGLLYLLENWYKLIYLN